VLCVVCCVLCVVCCVLCVVCCVLCVVCCVFCYDYIRVCNTLRFPGFYLPLSIDESAVGNPFFGEKRFLE
jgi:hypothetical protein